MDFSESEHSFFSQKRVEEEEIEEESESKIESREEIETEDEYDEEYEDEEKIISELEDYSLSTEQDIEEDESVLAEFEMDVLCSKTVFIFNYGPYEFRGIIAHRKNRMAGLAEKIKEELGARVLYKPVEIYDRLSIELDGQVVFTCRLTYLEYDSDCTDYTSALAFLKCQQVMEGLKREREMKKCPLVDPYILMTKSFC